MGLMTITLDKVEEFLSTIPSKNTRKSYVSGLKRLEAYFGKSKTTLIKSLEATREIEKFYVWLKGQGTPQNSCRNIMARCVLFSAFLSPS